MGYLASLLIHHTIGVKNTCTVYCEGSLPSQWLVICKLCQSDLLAVDFFLLETLPMGTHLKWTWVFQRGVVMEIHRHSPLVIKFFAFIKVTQIVLLAYNCGILHIKRKYSILALHISDKPNFFKDSGCHIYIYIYIYILAEVPVYIRESPRCKVLECNILGSEFELQ